MRRRECERCGEVTYWSDLEDEPAPCCYAPTEPVEYSEPDYDPEEERRLDYLVSPDAQFQARMRKKNREYWKNRKAGDHGTE